MPSLSALLAPTSLLSKWQYLGCWHTRTSWMSWLMESVKPCVYTLNMEDALWRILNWIPIYRSWPIFHWLQLASLMCCPLHDSRLINDLYCVHRFTTWFKWCGTHLEVNFRSCRSCPEIPSTVDPKLRVWWLIPFTLQPLSLSMHCSITAIEVSVETKCLLWYMSTISKCCQYNDVCTWNVCALPHSHLILTFIRMCCMLSSIHTHAAWPRFCPKGILVKT